MAFTTKEEVQKRLLRPLTEEEEASMEFLLEAAQGAVEIAVDRVEKEIVALKGNVPRVVQVMTVELVYRVLSNPQGLSSQSEALGSYSRTDRFQAVAEAGGFLLSALEERMVRNAVYGRLSGSARLRSLLSEECGS